MGAPYSVMCVGSKGKGKAANVLVLDSTALPSEVLWISCLDMSELFWQQRGNIHNLRQVVIMLWLVGVYCKCFLICIIQDIIDESQCRQLHIRFAQTSPRLISLIVRALGQLHNHARSILCPATKSTQHTRLSLSLKRHTCVHSFDFLLWGATNNMPSSTWGFKSLSDCMQWKKEFPNVPPDGLLLYVKDLLLPALAPSCNRT